MYQKSRRFQTKIITYAVLVIFSLLVIGVFVYSYVSKYQENKLDIKSRYTFSIRIDDQWNVVSDDYVSDYDNDNVSNFTNPDMVGLGTKWLEKYISQYRQKYVPYSKYIVKSGIDSVSVLDLSSNTVLLSFWVIPQNLNSDYFSSWEGIQDDGRIKCEWVVSFYLDNNYDNTAKLYVTSVMSSEDYGLKQYYAQQGIDSGGDTEITSNSNKDQLANYSIKDNSLLVTYDREKYISVPVSYSYLLYEPNSSTTLKEGSYMITTEKTAFVYGGKTANNTKIPVTVVYSDDKGENWTTCELDKIYTADYYYVKFFDSDNGVIVCGYAKSNDTNESSRIYSTSNGGESWDIVGSGPATNIIKGVGDLANFIFGCTFVIPAGIIYRLHNVKSRKHAVVGMAVGTVLTTIAACLMNAFVLLPAYGKAFGMPIEAFIEMGAAVNHSVNSLLGFVALIIVPFNLFKYILVSVIVFFIYKRIRVVLKGD